MLLTAVQVEAQNSTLSTFTASTFAKATTREDTSSTLTVGSYPAIYLHITSTGTDSALIYQNVDAYINSVWVNNIIRDTLTLGRPTGYILAGSGKGQVRYRQLRAINAGTDLIGGALYIRVRNKFATGAGDSNAATTYTQKVILSKF